MLSQHPSTRGSSAIALPAQLGYTGTSFHLPAPPHGAFIKPFHRATVVYDEWSDAQPEPGVYEGVAAPLTVLDTPHSSSYFFHPSKDKPFPYLSASSL